MQLKCLYIKTTEQGILVQADKIICCPELKINLVSRTPLLLEGNYITPTKFNCIALALDTNNQTALIALLKRRNFPGIGEIKAKHILTSLSNYAYDHQFADFGLMDYTDYRQALQHCQIADDVKEKIAVFFSGITARTELYKVISQYNGTFAEADRLYQKYHTGALDALQKDPYRGLDCGLSFTLCDQIAYQTGLSALNPKRLEAIGKVFQQELEMRGSCCLQFTQGRNTLSKIISTGVFPKISDITVLNYLTANHQCTIETDTHYGTLIYPIKLYTIEKQIVYELIRLNSKPSSIGFSQYSGGWSPDPDQLAAIGLIGTNGVKIVTGGPGTGKTSVIKEMIREYKLHADNKNIFLCAPTGAAAARINQSMNQKYHAHTIHKLIDVRRLQDDRYIYKFNKKNPLPKGLYVVDEMSMVGEEIFLHFLQAVPDGSTLILTGDIDQLQSVSSGTVLKDIIEAQVFETVRLQTVHRQDEQSMIVQNYYHIRNNDKVLENGNGFCVYAADTRQQRLNIVAGLYNYLKRQAQILTLTRQGLLGKDNLDMLITQAFSDKAHEYKHTGFYLGDRIMMLTNNYDKGYFNGDIGVITQILEHTVQVQFAEGLLELSEDDLLQADHAWSCTVHKAQGSEYDNIIVVVDDEYPNMLYRSILLTAITRAKKQVHVVTTKDALKMCLSADNEQLRVTGLSHLLRLAAKEELL